MVLLKKVHGEFVEHLKKEGKSTSTVIAYSKDIEQLIEHLHNQEITDVEQVALNHLEDFMARMARFGLANKSISRKTNATKTFFKFLKSKGHLLTDVSEHLKHPKIVNKPPRILSKVEYRALRDTAKDDSRSYAIIEVLLQTGITISELSFIEMEHIKLSDESGTLYIPAYESREDRKIPLNKAVLDAIKNYIEGTRPKIKEAKHLFITKTGNQMLVRNIRSIIDRIFKQAGIENVKVNDLRHTFIAHHLMQGTNINVISKIVGHKRLSTTEKYLEYVSSNVEEQKLELGVL